MSGSDAIFVFLLVLLGGWAAVAFYARQRGLDFEPEAGQRFQLRGMRKGLHR